MARAFIGVGSNVDRDNQIRTGIHRLRDMFGDILVSSVYESKAIGFEGENFYNLVVGIETESDAAELSGTLRAIEYEHGRVRNITRYSPRTLDLDLLLYNDLVRHDSEVDVPREDISKYAFVLCPLAEIAGELRHPETGESFADMWESFDKHGQEICRINFEF